MTAEYKKIRLSIEKTNEKTRRYLEEKRAAAFKTGQETSSRAEAFVNFQLAATLADLLSGIHVLSAKPVDNYDIIRNNQIEALAAEFPELVL